jgi:hypothetical protein
MRLAQDRPAPKGLIAEPGCFVGLDLARYHGQPTLGPSISSSGLRTIWAESPAHYWCRSPLNPDRLPEEDKPHFALGRVAHTLLLEGRDGLLKDYALRPEEYPDYRTKEARVWRDEQVLAGRTIITQSDLEKVEGMARSLSAHPLVKAGILDGAVERSLIWKDPETGVWLKARPDVIPNASGDFSDLKTTPSVAYDALERSLASYHYAMQGALVAMASEAVLGLKMQSFTLVWVEKEPPFCVRVTTLDDADLERGARQVRAALRTFAHCLNTGHWPGPGGDRAEYLRLPTWAANRVDTELQIATASNDTAIPDEAA